MEGGKGQESCKKEKEAIKIWRTRGGVGKMERKKEVWKWKWLMERY